MKVHTVYLFYSPNCIRNWLAYIKTFYGSDATVIVEVEAKDGASAKNKAITAANNRFNGVKIIAKNSDHKLWGIYNFPELHYLTN